MADTEEHAASSSFLTALPANWIESCRGVSSAAQDIATRWVESRAEQLRANLDACAKLTGCKSPGEFAEVQERWWQDTIDHLSAEMKGYQDAVLALTGSPQPTPEVPKPARRRAG